MADDLEAAVSRWAADHDLREEARSRAAARRLADEAREDTDLAGVLRGLAARRIPVRVAVPGGRSHRGVLDVVGQDYVGLATPRAWGLVALRAVGSVGTGPPGGGPAGGGWAGGSGPHAPPGPGGGGWARGPDWASFPPPRLADAAERLAGQDLPVRVHCLDQDTGTVGELVAAGADFLQIHPVPERPDPGHPRSGGTLYVPLASVAELWVLFRSG